MESGVLVPRHEVIRSVKRADAQGKHRTEQEASYYSSLPSGQWVRASVPIARLDHEYYRDSDDKGRVRFAKTADLSEAQERRVRGYLARSTPLPPIVLRYNASQRAHVPGFAFILNGNHRTEVAKRRGLHLISAFMPLREYRQWTADAHMKKNPRFVFRGVHGLIPTTEPAKIIGLTGKKREFVCKVTGYTIYRVDGKHVRAQWADFIGGGHHAAYRFIPKGDIWIDSTVREWGGFLASHELLEALLMDLRDWSYQRAHEAANALEQELRGYAEHKSLNGGAIANIWFAHLVALFPNGEAQRTIADTVARMLWRFL